MSSKSLSFSAKIYWYTSLTVLLCAVFIFIYSAFFISLRPSQLLWALIFSSIVFSITQFIVPFINKVITRELERKINLFEENQLDIEERTKLIAVEKKSENSKKHSVQK